MIAYPPSSETTTYYHPLCASELIKMKIDKSKHPLKLLEDFELLIKELRELALAENNLIVEEEGQKLDKDESSVDNEQQDNFEYLRFKFNNSNYFFLFTIDDIELTINNSKFFPKYGYYKSPSSDSSTKNIASKVTRERIILEFKDWIGLVKRYEKLSFKDPLTQSSENEIFQNLKIHEEDADTQPFSTEQQIFIIRYLDSAKKYLEQKANEYETAEIIYEIEEFKKDVTRLPKNSTMKRLSTILAKSKKQGLELFNELMKMLKKDLMKKVLTEGFEYVEGLLKLMSGMS